jgi:metal-responsive CopG/Arc/MetJ family transcriptional regulator
MSQEKSVKLTISMPLSVFNLLNEVAEQNKRSKLITEAVKLYARELKQKALKDRLREGYQARAERDKAIAEEWIALE